MKEDFIEFLQNAAVFILTLIFAIGCLILILNIYWSTLTPLSFVVGVACIFFSGLLYYFMEQDDYETGNNKTAEEEYLNDLKKNGIQLRVKLSDCKISSRSWTVTRERYSNSRVVFFNVLSGDSDKNVYYEDCFSSIIEYRHKMNGKTIVFKSSIINKDEISLRLLLELQGETIIYIDKDRPKYYFFDLDFLCRENE